MSTSRGGWRDRGQVELKRPVESPRRLAGGASLTVRRADREACWIGNWLLGPGGCGVVPRVAAEALASVWPQLAPLVGRQARPRRARCWSWRAALARMGAMTNRCLAQANGAFLLATELGVQAGRFDASSESRAATLSTKSLIVASATLCMTASSISRPSAPSGG